MGNLLAVVAHAANIHDTKAGMLAAEPACRHWSGLKRICADAGYRGTFVREFKERFSLEVDISEKIKPDAWEKLPWRWGGERTFARLNHSRRLSKDYEISASSAEAMVSTSHLHTLTAQTNVNTGC